MHAYIIKLQYISTHFLPALQNASFEFASPTSPPTPPPVAVAISQLLSTVFSTPHTNTRTPLRGVIFSPAHTPLPIEPLPCFKRRRSPEIESHPSIQTSLCPPRPQLHIPASAMLSLSSAQVGREERHTLDISPPFPSPQHRLPRLSLSHKQIYLLFRAHRTLVAQFTHSHLCVYTYSVIIRIHKHVMLFDISNFDNALHANHITHSHLPCRSRVSQHPSCKPIPSHQTNAVFAPHRKRIRTPTR